MARSLRVAILGFSVGFLLAGVWDLTQPGNHRLASALFVPAGVGILSLGVFVLVDSLRARRWVDLEDVDGPEFIPTHRAPAWPARPAVSDPLPVPAATAVAAADAAAVRIAELEARLAVEQQELENVVHALAETSPFAPSRAESALDLEEADSEAAGMEPLLRQEVLETLVELVGTKEDVIRQFEAMTAPGPASGRTVERRAASEHPVAQPNAPKQPVPARQPVTAKKPASKQRAASEQSQLQPMRSRRKPVKPKAALDERAERVGKRDLRRGRARHTQQVGRADEEG
jgi:hypothetical protein